jgi:serine phosphatase RsbU (regulator of sigma subunit)
MRLPFLGRAREVPVGGPTLAELPVLAGADIAGMVHGNRVGGDFYQFARASRARVVFGLLDVAGKRDANREIVAAARQTFQAKASVSLGDEEANEADGMMEFCQELNASIRAAAKGIHSCAAFLGCYNEELGTVCYVNAGHTPGLLRYNSDVSELPATGMPLGLFSASTYEAPTAAVPAGGGLLLVSRGMVEATQKKEEFGLPRLKELFLKFPLYDAQVVATSALVVVEQFAPAAAQQNDLTTLALVRPVKSAIAN